MEWLGDGSHRGQGCQTWTAVGLPPRYPRATTGLVHEVNMFYVKPFGGWIPRAWKRSLWVIGRTTASINYTQNNSSYQISEIIEAWPLSNRVNVTLGKTLWDGRRLFSLRLIQQDTYLCHVMASFNSSWRVSQHVHRSTVKSSKVYQHWHSECQGHDNSSNDSDSPMTYRPRSIKSVNTRYCPVMCKAGWGSS